MMVYGTAGGRRVDVRRSGKWLRGWGILVGDGRGLAKPVLPLPLRSRDQRLGNVIAAHLFFELLESGDESNDLLSIAGFRFYAPLP